MLKKKDEAELRPGMSGVYYKGGYAYATDAHSLIKMKSDYPKRYEGKVIGKDGNVVKVAPMDKFGNRTGKPVEANAPNYPAVIPNLSDYREYTVNVSDLENAVKKMKDRYSSYMKSKSGEWSLDIPSTYIILAPKGTRRGEIEAADNSWQHTTDGTQGVAGFDMDILKKIVYFMKSENTDKIYLHKNKSQSRAMLAKSDNGIALAMPVFIGDPEKRNGAHLVWITPTGTAKTNQSESKKQTKPTKTDTNMKKTTKKTACSTNGTRKSSSTMKTASKILHAQKDDYKKIFRTEVKKSKNPNEGAKKAGRIYRDRYGATAKARWRKALKRAK